ncbi:semaphorin-1A [Trichonephila clavipes]|nr:semaphorin-1A [Trichonephila clavipes]
MPTPVQSNCDAHDTIANGQYGAVWSMGHTQQVCVRIVLLPSHVWQQFFGRSTFLRQQETDLPPAGLRCACFFADRTIYLSSAGVVLLTRPLPCRLLHIPVVLNDFHSRETTLNSISGSAVCAFRLEDILKTFDGAFKGHEDVNFNWLPVQNSKVPEPRPGQCVNDSRTLPEQTVNFIKNHNLMDQSVPAFWGKPIVIYTGFKYRYTHIAVDPQIETANGEKFDVLFIGTDNGKVIKALNGGSDGSAHRVIPIIVEEMLVFPQRVPISNLLVYHTMNEAKLVVVSQDEILTIPLHSCGKLARTCSYEWPRKPIDYGPELMTGMSSNPNTTKDMLCREADA